MRARVASNASRARVVEQDVIAGAATREVFTGVVEDAIGAELSCLLDVARAADGVHLRAQCLGDLHREGADAARRTVDDDELPVLHPAVIPQALQCGEARERHGGSLVEREVRGLALDDRSGDDVFRELPPSQPYTSSPGLKSSTAVPTASTTPAKSPPRSLDLGLRKPISRDVGPSLEPVPVDGVHRRRVDADEHLLSGRRGLRHICDCDRSVPRHLCSSHRAPYVVSLQRKIRVQRKLVNHADGNPRSPQPRACPARRPRAR